ncbi:MAG TPA: gliding motility-associated protein GldE [Ferruginibacter sp.]|nr:gliding motility-associated protein GldE [Ferruginibacter sp.]HRO05171.1 gliding motility-associated protein GldE [Ferruginibacter sp.]HRO95524.1 gliding motility-associated protein GldE [Ferruginibacter sp.]HRP50263.1 gliding motility-associated protein GldE [Ferruginibacter sp.]
MDYHSVIHFFPFHFLAITPVESTVLVVLVILLLVLSFLISGSEIAFFSLTSKDLNVLKTKRNPSFRRIVYLLEQPKNLLASMHIANTFVSIGIVLVSNTLMDEWMEFSALTELARLALKIVVIAGILILFAEVLPKVWATHRKLWFAASASLVIEIFNSILFRFSNRVVRYTDRIEKRMSGNRNGAVDDRSLDQAIDLLPEDEATPEEKMILKGIRKFSGTTVKQIMRSRLDVSGIEASSTFEEIMQRVKELNYSRLPVYRNNLDDIAGMIHTKDLLPYLNESNTFNWEQLIRQPYFVHEQKLIEDLLQEFRAQRKHFAIVVDEFGGTSGIVTLEDILEEIIGEIEDEFDDEKSSNVKVDDYTYIFEGKTMIPDACRMMKLPEDTFDEIRGESDSLAGLVLEIAGEFPQINQGLHSGNFTFIPLDINKNRIEKIKVLINPVQTDAE